MNTDDGEIRPIESVPIMVGGDLEHPWTELSAGEVGPMVALPQAERPAALAKMRALSPEQKAKAQLRQAEKMAARSRSRQRAHKAKRDHGRRR